MVKALGDKTDLSEVKSFFQEVAAARRLFIGREMATLQLGPKVGAEFSLHNTDGPVANSVMAIGAWTNEYLSMQQYLAEIPVLPSPRESP
jgi:hypothetical protein